MKTDGFCEITQYLPYNIRSRLLNISRHEAAKINEIRMGADRPLTVTVGTQTLLVGENGELLRCPSPRLALISVKELQETFFSLCERSVYCHQEELCQGFITLKNGHRVGVCGTGVITAGQVTSVKDISSLNIRIAHQIKGCAAGIVKSDISGGLVIAGPPGSGKTTLLRDVIRRLSCGEFGEMIRVAVVDERGEIAAAHGGVLGNDLGPVCDVLTGIPKAVAIMMAVRTMNPAVVAFDEMGNPEEIKAVAQGAGCGVDFITTVHAANTRQLVHNAAFRKLLPYIKNAVLLSDTPGGPITKYKVRTDENEINGNSDFITGGMQLGDIFRRETCENYITA